MQKWLLTVQMYKRETEVHTPGQMQMREVADPWQFRKGRLRYTGDVLDQGMQYVGHGLFVSLGTDFGGP